MKKTFTIIATAFLLNANAQEINLNLKKSKNCMIAGGSFLAIGSVISIVGSAIDPPKMGSNTNAYPRQLDEYNTNQKALKIASGGTFLISGIFFIASGAQLYKSDKKKIAVNTKGNNISICYNF